MQDFVTDDTLAKVANVLGFLCAVLVAFLAYNKKQSKPDSSVEVAGALIDSTMANILVTAIDRNTNAHHDYSIQVRLLRESLDDNTRDMNRLRDAIVISHSGH